uniref:Single-stranded DNA binding protein Ssb-like OB fold domain-containing protein n=1 Tax=Noccaea caerulescens TaxID=107243 RepID=A0A1J3DIC7_NOCCA
MASNTSDNSQQRPRQRNGPPPPRRQGRNPPPPSSSSTRTQSQPQPQEQTTTQEKRKPVFVKVDDLKPGTKGHTLTVKVVDQNSVPQKPGAASSSHLRPARISECLVGDETASILFTARNDQVDLMKPGTTVNLRNAKIDMFKGSMRLAVDKWGRIEVTEPAEINVKEDNNLSLVEYELVNVDEIVRNR